MKNVITLLQILYISLAASVFHAACWQEQAAAHTCTEDHIAIGCNPDGLWDSADEPNDDRQLFVSYEHVYRHTDPNDPAAASWANWYYPLYYSVIYGDYYVSEPGFGQLWHTDYPGGPIIHQEHMLAGTPQVDYDLWVRCTDISPSLQLCEAEAADFCIPDETMQFNLSAYAEHHVHMKYRAPTQHDLYWATFILYDQLDAYQPSEPFTLVFGRAPLPGDVWVDGTVDTADLAHLAAHWTNAYDTTDPNCLAYARQSDYFQRADINRDYQVNLLDWARLAANWLKSLLE